MLQFNPSRPGILFPTDEQALAIVRKFTTVFKPGDWVVHKELGTICRVHQRHALDVHTCFYDTNPKDTGWNIHTGINHMNPDEWRHCSAAELEIARRLPPDRFSPEMEKVVMENL